jgi:transcriptional regulator with XRE-family HTH domain
MTQAQLAEAFGCAESSVSLYETGRRPLTAEAIARLARLLDVSIDFMYGSEDDDRTLDAELATAFEGAPPHVQRKAKRVLLELLRQEEEESDGPIIGRRAA